MNDMILVWKVTKKIKIFVNHDFKNNHAGYGNIIWSKLRKKHIVESIIKKKKLLIFYK